MTPKARRQQQLTRESATRSATEAAIELFKTGAPSHKATQLITTRRTAKHAARCYGCDASGFPLRVWEYQEVAAGPAILCVACAGKAEAALRAATKAQRAPGRRGAPFRASSRRG
jgi:hypothetical protein